MSEHIPAQSFECRKWQYRQTKEGVVVSLLIHPNDVTPSLAMAALGTRFMVALAEINDDETPKGGDANTVESKPHTDNTKPPHAEQSATHGARKLSSQCALRCKDKRFWEWLTVCGFPSATEEEAAKWVRQLSGVDSRSEILPDSHAATKWAHAERRFQNWLTDQMHAGSYR